VGCGVSKVNVARPQLLPENSDITSLSLTEFHKITNRREIDNRDIELESNIPLPSDTLVKDSIIHENIIIEDGILTKNYNAHYKKEVEKPNSIKSKQPSKANLKVRMAGVEVEATSISDWVILSFFLMVIILYWLNLRNIRYGKIHK
jgi:hypothetical protein